MVLVYTDVECNCEVVSDGYPQSAPFGNGDYSKVAFEVKSRMITKGEDDCGIPMNQDEDAEGPAETGGGESTVEQAADVIVHFKLTQYPMEKKDFKAYFASYMKNVLMPKIPEAELPEFKKGIQALFVKMMEEYENADIFRAEKADEIDDPARAMPIYAYWEGADPAPRFIFLKHGLKEEKY